MCRSSFSGLRFQGEQFLSARRRGRLEPNPGGGRPIQPRWAEGGEGHGRWMARVNTTAYLRRGLGVGQKKANREWEQGDGEDEGCRPGLPVEDHPP